MKIYPADSKILNKYYSKQSYDIKLTLLLLYLFFASKRFFLKSEETYDIFTILYTKTSLHAIYGSSLAAIYN